MSAARRAAVSRAARRRTPAPAASAIGGSAASVALAVMAVATACAVDASAEAAFDAPKRLALIAGVTLTTAAFALGARPSNGGSPANHPASARNGAAGSARAEGKSARGPAGAARIAAALAVAALGAAVVAAFASTHRAAALDTLRLVLTAALLLPLGAARAFDGRGGRLVLGGWLAAAAANAVVALLQAGQAWQPFATEGITGRQDTGGFLGNEGQLAQALAIAAVAALGVARACARPALRTAAASVAALALAALAVTRNLTALMAFAAGAFVLVTVAGAGRSRRTLLVALVLALATVVLPTVRGRLVAAVAAVRAGDLDALVTYRLGPWAAAAEMVRAHPFVGVGPGAFAAEFVPRRLAAELRHERRFTIPVLTSTFGEAHDEPLHAAAEAGVPAALAAVIAAGLLLGALAVTARRTTPASRDEAALVLAVLVAGAVAALTWFPLQRPSSAVPLLLAAGRAFRLVTGEPAAAHVPAAAPRWLAGAAALLLLGTLVPEARRYAAERQLRRTTTAVYLVATAPQRVRDPRRGLALAGDVARDLASALPGDPRPRMLGGAAALLAGDAAGALAGYRSVLATGERAEIALNAGRAFEQAGNRQRARAAYLRAAWISPTLTAEIPEWAAAPVARAVARLEKRLRAGALRAPPPMPPLVLGPGARTVDARRGNIGRPPGRAAAGS